MTAVAINVRQNSYYEGVKSMDGNTYRLTFHWNTETEAWYMSIKGLNNTVEVNGIALRCGKDLFAKHGYVELGQLWVVDNLGSNEDPNYDDFGSRWTLEYTPVAS